MSITSHIAGFLPPRLITFLGNAQFKHPVLKKLLHRVSRGVSTRTHTIKHGIGKGLKFNPHGGNPGYALGTSGIEEQEALATYLQTGDTFYDIGANKGFYAILGAYLVGATGHVYAFEPFPESADAIRGNLKLNEFENTMVIQAAISNETTQGKLLLTGESFSFKLATSKNALAESDSESIAVPVYALDDLVEERALPPPDFVMIDVEGSEIEVFRGMQKIISEYRPAIICEIHWLKKEVTEILEKVFYPLGYTATQLDGSPLPENIVRYHLLLRPV